ncbi:MAG: hypothetical protein EFT35_06150 [Methanophagales archaeon ANME-1-THS]|nr:MAG: hypothetical protein EFT35_06150 [Methanophagales archaeon ANME-1-THS]
MKDVKKGVLKKEVVTQRMVVTAVVIAFAFATLIAPVAASVKPATQTITSYGQDFTVNYDNITIRLDGNKSSVIVGQVIQFYNATGNASGKVTLTGISTGITGEIRYSDASGRIDTSGMKTGDYNATGEPGTGCNETTISIGETAMELKLKKGTTTVTSIPQGTRITVKFTSSLDPNDGVTLKVTDPGGNIMRTNPADGTVFDKVNVSHVTDLEINTAGWELGTYKFQISTEDEYARGLRKESDEVKLEIVSPELKLKAAKTELVVSEKVKLTVTGVSDRNISINVTKGGEYAYFEGGISDNPASTQIGNFPDRIDADGKREYVVYFVERIGTYTVKVRDLDSAVEDSVDISVSKKKVTFTMPNTCMIGADLVVNGTANTGKTVDIAIENRIVKVDVAIDTKGKFEVKLPTPATAGTSVEGAIKIKAFIDGNFSLEQDVRDEEDDGSFMVLMTTGTLTAESSTTLVPPGDSFTLSGIAPGKTVDVFIAGPKGGGGRGMNTANSDVYGLPHGIIYEAESVSSDFTWSVEIDVQEDADTGTYLVFVLSPGRNGIYDGIGDDDLLNGLKTKYFGGDLSRLAGKTQEQINATLWDATIGTAGSDDYMKKITIKVGTAEVKLYSLADIDIGSDLLVTGTSNREGHSIIVKVKGPVDLGTKFATVENGKFKAMFSTSEALTGEYTIEADDGEGHMAITTVNIITPVRTLASPTPAPTNSSVSTIPHEVPESTPTIQSPTMQPPTIQPENSSASTLLQLPVPGFEVVLVIIAVLTVYLLVCRTGKRKG